MGHPPVLVLSGHDVVDVRNQGAATNVGAEEVHDAAIARQQLVELRVEFVGGLADLGEMVQYDFNSLVAARPGVPAASATAATC